MNKRIFALLLAALLILIASGCSKKQALPEQKTADILATTQPVYQLASALTDGTGLSVSLLISEPVSCLHDYTLTVSQMEKIEGAQLVLESGLGLEDFMEDALSGKTRIDISSGLPTLTGDEGVDPHWWLDPTRFQQAAATAARELGAQYPEFSDRIAENLAAFDEKLSDLQAYGDEALANLSCRELVTFHDGFSYFADSFGLTIAAAMGLQGTFTPDTAAPAVIQFVRQLSAGVGIPANLAQLNKVDPADFAALAELALHDTCMSTNQITPTRDEVVAVYTAAFRG